MRAERRRSLHASDAVRATATETGPSDDDAWQRLRPLLDHAMDELSERDRVALVLRFFTRSSYADIAQIDGRSEDAARVRVNRALDKLRQVLARRGFSSTSTLLSATLSAQPVVTAPTSLVATLLQTYWLIPAASSGTALITLMNAKTTATIATAAAALALGVAWYQTAELHQLRQSVRGLAAESSRPSPSAAVDPADTHRTPKLPATPPPDQTPRPSQNHVAASGIGGAAVPGPVGQVLPSNANPLRTLWGLRADSSAMQAWLEAQPSELDRQLGPAFQLLHLSEQDSEHLKAILMEKFQTIADIASSAQANGVDATDPSVRGLLRDATTKAENSLRTLLGDTAYQQLRDYGATQSVREIVRTLAGDLYYSAPLTSVQGEQLVAIIARESPHEESGANPAAANWTRILEAAAGVLTPTQLKAFRAQLAQVQLRSRRNQASPDTGRAR